MPDRARHRSSLLASFLLAATVVGCAPGATATDPSASTPRPTPTPAEVATRSARPGPSATAPAEAGGAYLAIGDSVTFGIGVPQPRRDGFPARLVDRLAMADLPITETRVFAVPGETASGFLERRLDDVLAAIDELGTRVEVVTIGLGANELLRVRRDPACEADPDGEACLLAVSTATVEATDALDAVVASVQQALDGQGADARILVLAYYNPDVDPVAAATVVGTDGAVACHPPDATPGLNDRIACVAEARGLELVDLYAAFVGREAELTRIGDGDVHPNEKGHEVIAETIAATIVAAP
ncbi:MAG: SGNH/GDSL hydrolase family protein [Chloroflexota bacterium]